MSTVDVLTARGAVVRIRPVTGADAGPLLTLHERVSGRGRYLRFFSAAPSLSGEVERLVRADDGKHLALLAEDGGQAIGVASYEVTDVDHAEFAVLVDDARQGEGVGTLLLEQLAAEGRRRGIAELVGEVLPNNAMMLRVSRDLAPGSIGRWTTRTGWPTYGCRRPPTPPPLVWSFRSTSVAVALVGVAQPPTTLGSRRVPVFPLPEDALPAKRDRRTGHTQAASSPFVFPPPRLQPPARDSEGVRTARAGRVTLSVAAVRR